MLTEFKRVFLPQRTGSRGVLGAAVATVIICAGGPASVATATAATAGMDFATAAIAPRRASALALKALAEAAAATASLAAAASAAAALPAAKAAATADGDGDRVSMRMSVRGSARIPVLVSALSPLPGSVLLTGASQNPDVDGAWLAGGASTLEGTDSWVACIRDAVVVVEVAVPRGVVTAARAIIAAGATISPRGVMLVRTVALSPRGAASPLLDGTVHGKAALAVCTRAGAQAKTDWAGAWRRR